MSICTIIRKYSFIFFFNDTATTEIYTLSLHDALPISVCSGGLVSIGNWRTVRTSSSDGIGTRNGASELNFFQSFAASRRSAWRRIMGIFSAWNGHRRRPSLFRASRKGSEISLIKDRGLPVIRHPHLTEITERT